MQRHSVSRWQEQSEKRRVFSRFLSCQGVRVDDIVRLWLPKSNGYTRASVAYLDARTLSFFLPFGTIDADLPKNTKPDKTQLLDNRVRLTIWYIHFVPNSGVCVIFQPTPPGYTAISVAWIALIFFLSICWATARARRSQTIPSLFSRCRRLSKNINRRQIRRCKRRLFKSERHLVRKTTASRPLTGSYDPIWRRLSATSSTLAVFIKRSVGVVN